MPRALPNSPYSQRKAKDQQFRALISRAGTEDKIKKYQIAGAMRCTTQTFRNKMANPESLTLGELRGIAELLGWGEDELRKII